MEEDYREVHFWEYCSSCKHETLEENEYPCFICLNEPSQRKNNFWKDFERVCPMRTYFNH